MEKRTWKEFQDCKLLWWVNRSLHLFGWAIVIETEQSGEITNVYPARVSFRGFSEDAEEEGFVVLTDHLSETIAKLKGDTQNHGKETNPC